MPVAVLLVFVCFVTATLRADEIRLIQVGDLWHYYKGTNTPAGGDWRSPAFNDSDWNVAPGGFSMPHSYPERTVLSDYGVNYRTVYFRKSFFVGDTNNVGQLVL